MTLHEAIEKVLQNAEKPLFSRDIADTINNQKLYKRKDGLPVSASQVTTRANNYTKLFTREAGKIKLVKDDIVSLKFQHYRNRLVHESNAIRVYGRANKIDVLVHALEELLHEDNYKFNYNSVSEPNFEYADRNNQPREKLLVAYKLCDWFFKQSSKHALILNKMSYNTRTNTNTYTVVDIRKTFENCEADLRTIARRTGKWSQEKVSDIMHDAIKLSESGYLDILSIALKRSSDNYTLRAAKFTINENGTTSDSERAGRNNDWENIDGTYLTVYLTYSSEWFDLSASEKTSFQNINNFKISWTTTSDDTSFSHLSSSNAQLYGSKGYEVQKTNFK